MVFFQIIASIAGVIFFAWITITILPYLAALSAIVFGIFILVSVISLFFGKKD